MPENIKNDMLEWLYTRYSEDFYNEYKNEEYMKAVKAIEDKICVRKIMR